MRTFSQVLTKIAYFILLILPFAMATVFAVICLKGGWGDIFQYHTPNHYSIPEFTNMSKSILAVIVLVILIVFILKVVERFRLNPIVVTVVITVLSRLVTLVVFSGEIEPFSDGLYAWQRVHGDMTTLQYASFFPGWVNYTLFLQLIVDYLQDNYMLVLYSNVVFNAITAAMIFPFCRLLGLRKNTSFAAALFYALNPTGIFYVTFDTPEHLAIAMNMLAVYFIVKLLKEEAIGKKLLCAGLAGVFLGIASSVKTFGIIFLIAFAIAGILKVMYYAKEDREKTNSGFFQKPMGKLLFGLATLFFMYELNSLVVTGVTTASEQYYQIHMDSADATPHYLLVGLNYTGEGQQHVGEVGKSYIYARQSGIGLEEGKILAKEVLQDNWKGHENPTDVMNWLVRKMVWAWQDDIRPIVFFTDHTGIDVNSKSEDFVYCFAKDIAPAGAEIWYLLLMLFSAIGIIYIIFDQSNSKVPNQIRYIENQALFFIGLIILGYFSMMIISEAQSRYKCLIMPFVGIFAALGVEALKSLFKKFVDRRVQPEKLQRI